MTDKDKTVGGRTQRTRAEWFEALVFPFKAMKRADWVPLEPSDWDALLDAAFPPDDAHSRGIREGLERATKEVCEHCRNGVTLTDRQTLVPYTFYHLKGTPPYQEPAVCAAERIHLAIRAEASKLEG